MSAAAGRSVMSAETFPNTGGYSVYVVQFDPKGYLVLNSDDRLPLVVCFSAESSVNLSDVPENAFRSMLLDHVARMEEELEKPFAPQAMAEPGPLAVTELYGPFLETTWNQNDPYNLLCPDDPGGGSYYGDRAPSGCTPTAYAQLLQFHRWPFFGEGSHAYTDNSGSITGAHSVDFSDVYDWGNMLPAHSPSNPQANQDAVAELMYELGVAAEADYESDGTSSSIVTLGNRLGEYLYFESCDYYHNQSSLIAPMETDLRAGFPCVVAIPGHAIVADGLMVDSGVTTYHINYGWGGQNNNWWDANSIPGGALQYGITSLRPQLLAFPMTNEVSGDTGGSVEVQWILPKRREAEAEQLKIYEYNESSEDWDLFWTDDTLASRRFSEVTTLWDDCDDFSVFEVTTTGSVYDEDWVVSAVSGVGNCFYKTVPEYNGVFCHLTSLSTITPTASTRLLLHAKYTLADDIFRILISTDRSSFTEIWSDSSSMDWSEIAIDLSAYAGQAIYVRLEYEGATYYPGGGVWIDSISTQEVTNPEYEGQPVHYTVLSNLTAGTYTLAATLTDTNTVEHGLAPAFTLTVSGTPDDGDGMPTDWELMYGLDPNVDDGALNPDGDDYSNFEEYICGTVPTNAASCWLLEAGAGGLPAFYAVEERLYAIQYRTNMLDGSWITLASDIPGSNSVIAVSDYDSATNAARFYRVQVGKED
ncbi:MAG: C10 family peptidase, partial [Verrucomicrobiota bacterium]